MIHKAKTFCRNCGALCSMEVTVDDGKLIAVSADGTASPYGPYMCIKGQSSIDFHNGAEQRLLRSLKRDDRGQHAAIATRFHAGRASAKPAADAVHATK
jgi:predicted molibdopterin-dependent oxidoreductase YjgC